MNLHGLYAGLEHNDRPFDDQRQPRIWLETLAFAVILQMAEEGHITLVGSSVLDYENSRNPNPSRKRWVQRCRDGAGFHQPIGETIRTRELELERSGVTALDALHVASAEMAKTGA